MFGTGGCVAPVVEKNLAAGSAAREVEARALFDKVESGTGRTISWDDAHRRMFRDNLGLRQSEMMLTQAERETKRQWLGLVPRLSAFLNISKGLSDLANIESDNFNASLIGSFSIPNPFEFYAALYGAELQTQNARWSHQLDERRAFIELYSAFLDARALAEEKALLERRRTSFSLETNPDIARALLALGREKDAYERRALNHRTNVNRLLNTPGEDWNLTGRLPEVSYRSRYRNLRIGGDFGKMALNLYAVRIESSIMQTQRVKYQQWPSIAFGVSNPPLYTSAGGSDGLSGEDMTLFSGASKTLDVTDIGGRQAIQDAETRLKFTHEQLLLSVERESVRLYQMRGSYDRLLAEERRLVSSIARLDRSASAEAEVVLADLESRSQFELQLIQTRRQIEQLDLQYLIWDERFWKS